MERNVCTDLKVFLRYDYFPSKLTKKSLSSVHDVDAGDKNHPAGILIEGKCDDNDIKLNCNDKIVQGDRRRTRKIDVFGNINDNTRRVKILEQEHKENRKNIKE